MNKKRDRNKPQSKAAAQQPAPRPSPLPTVKQTLTLQQSWHGPLPAPENLAEFNAVLPGCAERIVTMAEQEGRHSRRTQFIAVCTASAAQILGQLFALLIAGGGMYAAYLMAMANHDGVAIAFASTTITTVALAFLQARRAAKQASKK